MVYHGFLVQFAIRNTFAISVYMTQTARAPELLSYAPLRPLRDVSILEAAKWREYQIAADDVFGLCIIRSPPPDCQAQRGKQPTADAGVPSFSTSRSLCLSKPPR